MANIYVGKTGLSGTAGNDSLTRATQNAYTPLLTIQRANDVALASDRIIVREGTYRESLNLTVAGSASQDLEILPFTNHTATISGAEYLTGWTQCASAAEAGGNANYANIYYAYIPAANAADALPFTINIHEGGVRSWIAQTPVLTDPSQYKSIQEYTALDRSAGHLMSTSSGEIGATLYIEDTTNLNQSDSTYYDDSWVAYWVRTDRTMIEKITGFNPATDTITASNNQTIYSDRTTYYSILGGVTQISQAGEFATSYNLEVDGTRKVFYWPYNSADLTNIEYTVRPNGIDLNNNSYVRVGHPTTGGFTITQCGGSGDLGGSGIITGTGTKSNITVANNTIRHGANHVVPTRGYGNYFTNITNCIFKDNYLDQNIGNWAMFFNQATNCQATGNTFKDSGHSPCSIFYSDYIEFSWNTIDGIGNAHANLTAIYLGSSNVLWACNTITNAWGASLTISNLDGPVWIYGNLFDCNDDNDAVNTWSPQVNVAGTNCYFLQNTVARATQTSVVNLNATGGAVWHVYNNVTCGGPCSTNITLNHDYNTYTQYMYCQDPAYSWALNTNEVYETDETALFNNYATADFTPLSSGALYRAGTDIQSLLPTSIWPDFDFSTAPDGTARNLTNPSMGCYE